MIVISAGLMSARPAFAGTSLNVQASLSADNTVTVKFDQYDNAQTYNISRVSGTTVAPISSVIGSVAFSGGVTTTSQTLSGEPVGVWEYQVEAFSSSTASGTALSSQKSSAITISAAAASGDTTTPVDENTVILNPTTMMADCVAAKKTVDDDKSKASSSISRRSLYDAISDNSVKAVFKWTLSLVNILVLIFLLVVSFSSILRVQIDTYAVKKVLPALIMGIVLANFSWLICRFLIEVSTLITNSLLAQYGGAGELFRKIAESYGLRDTLCTTATTGNFASGLLGVFVGTVLVVVAAILMLTLYMLLVARIWIITLLMILAPLAFISLGFPLTSSYFKKWWTMFFNWVFMTPAAFLILILAERVSIIGKEANLTRYILTTALLYFAIQVPFKMGGDWMRQWGGYVSQFKKKAYEGTAKAVDHSTKGTREDLANRARLMYRNSAVGQDVGRRIAGIQMRRDLRKKELDNLKARDRGNARDAAVKSRKLTAAQAALQDAQQVGPKRKEIEDNMLKAFGGNTAKLEQFKSLTEDEKSRRVNMARSTDTSLTKKERDKAARAVASLSTKIASSRSRFSAAELADIDKQMPGNLDAHKADQDRIKAAQDRLAATQNKVYGRSYEAAESALELMKGEEGSKKTNQAAFDETELGRQHMNWMTEYAFKMAKMDARTQIAKEQQSGRWLKAFGVDPNKPTAELIQLAKEIGADPKELGKAISDNFTLRSDAAALKDRNAKTDEDNLVKVAREQLTLHNTVYKVRNLRDQMTQTQGSLDAAIISGDKIQEKLLTEMLKVLKSQHDAAVVDHDSTIDKLRTDSNNNFSALAPHLQQVMTEGAGGTIAGAKELDSGTVLRLVGRVKAWETGKAANRLDDTGILALSQKLQAGSPEDEITQKQVEAYRAGNFAAIDDDISKRADIVSKINIWTAAVSKTLGGTTNPDSDMVSEMSLNQLITPETRHSVALQIARSAKGRGFFKDNGIDVETASPDWYTTPAAMNVMNKALTNNKSRRLVIGALKQVFTTQGKGN